MPHWVYILRSEATGELYIGETRDPDRRLAYHNRGLSRFTRSRGPWRLAYKEAFATRRDAIRRERQLKAWKSRKAIEELIDRKAITC